MTTPLKIRSCDIHGFNYQPSYSACAFETWRRFDADAFNRELGLGKKHFPKMNAVRLWLSWNAWCANPTTFVDAFSRALDICEKYGLMVVPVLYNRWHDSKIDCDGIYIDHFLPGASWLQKYGLPGREFTVDIAKNFGKDERILAWDLCNEPFAYTDARIKELVLEHEINWLKTVNGDLHDNGITQPVGVGTWNKDWDPIVNDFVDCFMTHMYLWIPADKGINTIEQNAIDYFGEKLQMVLDYADSVGKPFFTTETCWGSFDDAFRAQLLEATISQCVKKKVGFFAYALYESDFTDIHRPSLGRLSPDIGHLEFIRKDGTLRPGHDVINKYM